MDGLDDVKHWLCGVEIPLPSKIVLWFGTAAPSAGLLRQCFYLTTFIYGGIDEYAIIFNPALCIYLPMMSIPTKQDVVHANFPNKSALLPSLEFRINHNELLDLKCCTVTCLS